VKFQAVILILFALLSSGCGGWDANTPGVTKDPEQSAKEAFPDIPDGQQAADMRIEGEKLFKRFGCGTCHSTGEERNGLMGPPLAGVGDRHLPENDNDPLETRRWLVKHIKDPIAFPGMYHDKPEYKGTHMPPNPRISDEDLAALVEFLWHLR
jgi:mono/diheme cytochrome c family protein